MTSSAKKVTLISSDGDEFEIPINVAEQSILIQTMMDDVGDGGKIPISNVNSETLSKVLEYCQKHAAPEVAADEGGAANNAGGAEELKKWDAEFVKTVDKYDIVFKIIVAANYMDIKSLLDLTCQAVADMIKNKSPEEVRQVFNINNDLTPEEEAQIRKENEWAFEH